MDFIETHKDTITPLSEDKLREIHDQYMNDLENEQNAKLSIHFPTDEEPFELGSTEIITEETIDRLLRNIQLNISNLSRNYDLEFHETEQLSVKKELKKVDRNSIISAA